MTKMFAKVREKRMILGMRSLLFILTVVIVGVGSGCRVWGSRRAGAVADGRLAGLRNGVDSVARSSGVVHGVS